MKLKPKRIEWMQETANGYTAYMGGVNFAYHEMSDKTWYWYFMVWNKSRRAIDEGSARTGPEAQAACQSAFDAWVMQFMEPVKD